MAVGAIAGMATNIGTQYYSATKASGAALDAARVNAAASDRSVSKQLEANVQAREDTAPWREAGIEGLNALQQMQMPKFRAGQSPEYLGGQELLQGANTANGGRMFDEGAKDYASTKYGNHLKRYYDSLRPYQSLAGVGQSIASDDIQRNAFGGQSVANTLNQGGGLIAQNMLQSNVAQHNALSGMGQSVMDYAAMKQTGAI